MTGSTQNSVAPTHTPRRPGAGWSDGVCGGDISLRPLRLCVNPLMCHSRESGERSDRQVNPWLELSVNWFAQRHKGTKRLLFVFVSSCEPKVSRLRSTRTGEVDSTVRRPSVGWGLSRLSFEDSAIRQGAIGSSLRWSDGVCGERVSPLDPSACVARCMLKQVQHDGGRRNPLRPLRLCVNPLMCHSREGGNAWVDLLEKWFARRHEGTKKLLPVFVSSCELKSFYARQYRTMGSRFRGNDNVGVLGRINQNTRRPSAGWSDGLGSINMKTTCT
jgi:hypothetical protein